MAVDRPTTRFGGFLLFITIRARGRTARLRLGYGGYRFFGRCVPSTVLASNTHTREMGLGGRPARSLGLSEYSRPLVSHAQNIFPFLKRISKRLGGRVGVAGLGSSLEPVQSRPGVVVFLHKSQQKRLECNAHSFL